MSLQKGVDVRLAVDMVSMARKGMYGTSLLISGDADFTSAIQEVKDMGLHVELTYFLRDPQGRTGLSDQLKTAADKFIELSHDLLQDCWL